MTWSCRSAVRAGSVHPIRHAEVRDPLEVPQVAGDERGLVGQGNAGDQQVGPPHFLQALGCAKVLEAADRGLIQGDEREFPQELLRAEEQLLCPEKVGSTVGLEQEIKTPS